MDPHKPNKVLPIKPRETPTHSGLSRDEDGDESYREMLAPKNSEPKHGGSPLMLEQIPIEDIVLSPFQTRSIAGDDELEELKNSILARGIVQPIIVRPANGGEPGTAQYELIAGERRLRAATLAGLSSIPAIVQPVDDRGSVELMIIENAQRENLNPVEEAQAYLILADRFRLSHGDIAQIVGKNRATVSNSIRLLQLEPEVIELLRIGELTAGHGRALLMVEGAEWQLKLARLAVKKALSVRALEGLVSRLDEAELTDDEPSEEENRERQTLARAEARIGNYLGIEQVKLRTDTQGRRRLTLAFDTESAWRKFMSKIRD